METHIPVANNASKNEWMTPEILKLMEERRGYERGSEKYRPINKGIKNKCKIAHEDFIDMKCYEISQNYNPNSKQVHQDIKMISGKGKNKVHASCIKNNIDQYIYVFCPSCPL